MGRRRIFVATIVVAVTGGVGLGVAALRSDKDARSVPGFPEGGLRRAILEAPDRLEVLGLVMYMGKDFVDPGGERFHGRYRVLRAVAPTPPLRQRLVADLYQGLRDARTSALCFNPHHGIRATRGNDHLDLVICFECSQIYTFDTAEGGEETGVLATTEAARPVLDEILGKKR